MTSSAHQLGRSKSKSARKSLEVFNTHIHTRMLACYQYLLNTRKIQPLMPRLTFIPGDYYTTSAEPFTSSPASSVSAPVQASPSFIPSPTPELSSLVPSGTHSTHGRPPNPRHTHPHQHHNNAQYQLKMCQETTETFPCSTPGCTKKSMEDRKYYVDLCEEVLRDPNMRWGMCRNVQSVTVSIDTHSDCLKCVRERWGSRHTRTV